MRGDIRPVRRRVRRPRATRPPVSRPFPPPLRSRPAAPPAGGGRGRLRRAGLAALIGLAVVAIGLQARGSATDARGDVSASVQVARDAVAAAQVKLETSDLAGADQELATAESALGSANRVLAEHGLVGGIAAGPATGDIRTGQQLLAAGQATVRSARRLTAEIRAVGTETATSEQGFYRAGEVLNAHLPDVDSELSELDRQLKLLDFLRRRAADSGNPDLAAAGKEFGDVIPEARGSVAAAREVVAALPDFLGRDNFTRYLLLFQNPAELRPTGGFTGTYGRLTLDDGRLTEFSVDSIYNPSNQAAAVTKDPPPEPLKRLSNDVWRMVDANWDPDFPTTAKQYQRFYEKGGGPTTDGVIALTASPIVETLRVVGPIEQPETGVTLTADSFYQTVFAYQQENAVAGNDPKTLLRDFAPKLLEKIRQASPEAQRRVAAVFREAIRAKDIQLFVANERLQRLAAAVGIDGGLPAGPGSLAIVEANLGANKSSADITLSVRRTVTVGTDGDTVTELDIDRRHNAASTGDTNRTFTRIYLPKGSQVEETDGWHEFAPPHVDEVGDHLVVGGWSDVEPNDTRSITVRFRSEVDLAHGALPLGFWRQPGSNLNLATEVRLPEGYVWDGQPGATVSGTILRYEGPVRSDRADRLTYRKL